MAWERRPVVEQGEPMLCARPLVLRRLPGLVLLSSIDRSQDPYEERGVVRHFTIKRRRPVPELDATQDGEEEPLQRCKFGAFNLGGSCKVTEQINELMSQLSPFGRI